MSPRIVIIIFGLVTIVALSDLFYLSMVTEPPLEPKVSSTVLTGKVASNVGNTKTPYYTQWIKFQENIKTRSKGSIELDYHIMGDLGSQGDMLSALLRNRIQIFGGSHQSLATQLPEFAMISAPFLFDSYEELDFVLDEHLFDLFDDIAANRGLTLLQWAEVGWLDFYANQDIRMPEDVKDLRVRFTPNISAETLLQALDANAISLGSADLVQALQQGMIDAGVTGLVYHALVTKDYATHYVITNHGYDGGAVLAHREWFESATEEQQDIIRNAFGPAARSRQLLRTMSDQFLKEMSADGIKVRLLSNAERTQWKEATKDTHQEIIRKAGGRAQEVYDAILKGKAAFAEISEDQGISKIH